MPAPSADPQPQLFAPVEPIAPGKLPDLGRSPENFDLKFMTDWFRGLMGLAINNANHATGHEIGAEQNRRLGEIIAVLKADVPDAPTA